MCKSVTLLTVNSPINDCMATSFMTTSTQSKSQITATCLLSIHFSHWICSNKILVSLRYHRAAEINWWSILILFVYARMISVWTLVLEVDSGGHHRGEERGGGVESLTQLLLVLLAAPSVACGSSFGKLLAGERLICPAQQCQMRGWEIAYSLPSSKFILTCF